MSLLEMIGVCKSFGANQVLKGVDFTVEPGEIHALLGENGAGKSTLLNILAGVHRLDAGRVVFGGVDRTNASIARMQSAGVAFVHQELNVINDLTVAENLFFNRERSRLGILRRLEMLAETKDLFESLGVELDPGLKVSELRTSQKQLLEICRALHTDAVCMILDEPTTALGNDEIDHLFSIVSRLRDEGRSFIFVSHKMPEVFRLADTFTVLRNGVVVSNGRVSDASPLQLTRDLVGEKYADLDVYEPRSLGPPIIEARGLCGPGFADVDLQIRRGEIVALTGLAGSGASELMQTMFGALPATSGEILVRGEPVRGDIPRFMRNKVGMLPTNRKENSVLPDMSTLENVTLAEHSLSARHQRISRKRELARFERLRDTLGIKSWSPDAMITMLSGGNQQKVFFARWLNIDADVLLLDNPTQGVDVGAKEDIYALIVSLAGEGLTIVLNTLEIPEIKKVSDRCVVLYAGRVVRVFERAEINEHDVMAYSTNAVSVRHGDGRRTDEEN